MAGMHLAAHLWSGMAAARLAEARGDHMGVVTALSPFEALRDRDGVKLLAVQPWQSMLVVALAGCGDVVRARRSLSLLDAAVLEQGDAVAGIALARARAAVAVADSRRSTAAAQEILAAALAVPSEGGSPFERALTELMLGGLRRRGRQRAAARDLLVAARQASRRSAPDPMWTDATARWSPSACPPRAAPPATATG
jgi:hypothetical protein